MLRERSVQIKSSVEACEPAPGIGFNLEPDLVSRNDSSNNMRAAYPVVVRIDGEAGTKKTITGPGMHWIDGGFRRLDILDGKSGSYWRCTVAELKGDAVDVVPGPPTWHADPAFFGEKGFGPTPVVMLAGRLDNSDSTRGQAALWRFAYEGVPYMGLSLNGVPTPLRTDDLGFLTLSSSQRQPVKLAELTYSSSSMNSTVFTDGRSIQLTGVNGWTDDPAAAPMDVSGYSSLLFELNGGLNDPATPTPQFTIQPYIDLYAQGASVQFEHLMLTDGQSWRSDTRTGALMVGQGLENVQSDALVSRSRLLRLVKVGWFNANNTTNAVTALSSFAARLWGIP